MGWLSVKLVEVEALGNLEQHLVVAAVTRDGERLPEDDPEKLLRIPARAVPAGLSDVAGNIGLTEDMDRRQRAVLFDINQRNLGYFEQEVEKLDAWADDLKLGLEQDIKMLDVEIKEVRRAAAISPTLEEKLAHQKHQRELEARRSKLRRELFLRQDEVEAQRNDLITLLEAQLQQIITVKTLFSIEWNLI
jgi:hypothetical protein